MNPTPANQPKFIVVLLGAAIFLSAAATYAQVNSLGMHFLRVQQEKVHVQMLQGSAGNPWQYRILADAMLEPIIQLSKSLGIPQPESFSFISFRFLQCLFILSAAGVYYRKLGLTIYENLLGISVLTWSMSYGLYNSDLSFNVFFDAAFFLVAAILILRKQWVWVILLMIPAALNRETSALIPGMMFFAIRQGNAEDGERRREMILAGVALVVFAVVFAGLRIYYGQQPFLTADGYYPGIGLLALNLKRSVTWEQLAITLGIIPLLALISYREWPRTLRTSFWVVVPVWLGVHFFGALVAETRLLLVPQALVFIPGALFGVVGSRKPMTDNPDTEE